MSLSEDPSQVDTETVCKSLTRDLAQFQASLRQAGRWAEQARVTLYELERRAALQRALDAEGAKSGELAGEVERLKKQGATSMLRAIRAERALDGQVSRALDAEARVKALAATADEMNACLWIVRPGDVDRQDYVRIAAARDRANGTRALLAGEAG